MLNPFTRRPTDISGYSEKDHEEEQYIDKVLPNELPDDRFNKLSSGKYINQHLFNLYTGVYDIIKDKGTAENPMKGIIYLKNEIIQSCIDDFDEEIIAPCSEEIYNKFLTAADYDIYRISQDIQVPKTIYDKYDTILNKYEFMHLTMSFTDMMIEVFRRYAIDFKFTRMNSFPDPIVITGDLTISDVIKTYQSISATRK